MSRGILKWRVKNLETFENPEEKKLSQLFLLKKILCLGLGTNVLI